MMKANEEFKIGKHNIGYIDSSFTKGFDSASFEERPMPTFQKLPRSMNDATIESELNPRLCELGDIVSFLDGSLEECRDGYWNLFYMESFVVRVFWYSSSSDWCVSTWYRYGHGWSGGSRVFSPAAAPLEIKNSRSFDSKILSEILNRLESLENWKNRVQG